MLLRVWCSFIFQKFDQRVEPREVANTFLQGLLINAYIYIVCIIFVFLLYSIIWHYLISRKSQQFSVTSMGPKTSFLGRGWAPPPASRASGGHKHLLKHAFCLYILKVSYIVLYFYGFFTSYHYLFILFCVSFVKAYKLLLSSKINVLTVV